MAFPLQHKSLEMHPSCCVCQQSVPLSCGAVYSTVCIEGYLVVSSFWLSWIRLLWTFVYRILRKHKFSFLWNKCQRMQLLVYTVISWLVFLRNCQPAFQNDWTIVHSHQWCMSDPISLHPCQHLVLSLFLILSILIEV